MIGLFRPFVGEAEKVEVGKVIDSGWLGMGPATAEFEKRFGEFLGIGADRVVGLNSCTSALFLALKLAGVGPGDEVIVPTLTFCSTAHVVRHLGAEVVFADVESDTGNIEVSEISRLRTVRTKAVIAVHFAGRPVALEQVRNLCEEYGLVLVEDCAHATGSAYVGDHVGRCSFGKFGCFSFQAVKNLAMGDGGVLVCRDVWDARRARELRWLGISKDTSARQTDQFYSWDYNISEMGWKLQMNDVAAAIGLAQLGKLLDMQTRRVIIADQYRRRLAGLWDDIFDGMCGVPLGLPLESDSVFHSSWHIFAIRTVHRDGLMQFLADHGVSTGVHYRPLHMYSLYGRRERLPNAERIFEQTLSLPMHPGLSKADVAYVCDLIEQYLTEER